MKNSKDQQNECIVISVNGYYMVDFILAYVGLLYNIIILPNFATYGIEFTVFALYVLSATVLTTKYIFYYRRPSI